MSIDGLVNPYMSPSAAQVRAGRRTAVVGSILAGAFMLAASPAFADEIHGTSGDDMLYGTDEDDQIFGYGGDDFIFGYGGDDVIDGGWGSDAIEGGSGDDSIRGGPGHDQIFGGGGADELRGGLGWLDPDSVYGDEFDTLVVD